MTSLEAGEAIREGLMECSVPSDCISLRPISDGGEGTAEVISYARELAGKSVEKRTIEVTGPLGDGVQATYTLTQEGTAIIDMASAAGLPLVPEDKRNPFYTTTYGVGEMIVDAIEQGCRRFIIGIGGSATNDGGVGMLQALGFSFTDSNGHTIKPGAIGLKDLQNIELENVIPGLRQCSFRIACDVTNPLLGEQGCSYIFAPQKGATMEQVKEMDSWLKKYADIAEHLSGCDMSDIHFASRKVYEKTGKMPNRNTPGAGAAGGLGFAFTMFLGGILESGISIILDEIGAKELAKESDVVITGEGRIDAQTMMGKVISGICHMVEEVNQDGKERHVVICAGSEGEGADVCLQEKVVDSYHIITPEGQPAAIAMQNEVAVENLKTAIRKIMEK